MDKNQKDKKAERPATGLEKSTGRARPDLTKQDVETIISEKGLVFIDPLSDFGFKRLLGTDRCKKFTIHLLNTFIGQAIGDTVYASVPKVYSLSFMEMNMAEFKGRSKFFWKVFQKDDDNKIFSKENVLYFVELCKFAAQLETLDLTDEKNLWLFMLTHVADVSDELLERSDPIFRCFHRECLVSNLNDMEKKEYVKSVLEYDDVRESMMCEREVGREQGREEKTRLLVRNMLAEGLDPAMVAKITELTEGEVLAMREER